VFLGGGRAVGAEGGSHDTARFACDRPGVNEAAGRIGRIGGLGAEVRRGAGDRVGCSADAADDGRWVGRSTVFVSADVDNAADDACIPRTALVVRPRRIGIVASIDGRTAGQQGHRFGRAAVVLQRAEVRVDGSGGSADLVAVDAIGQGRLD